MPFFTAPMRTEYYQPQRNAFDPFLQALLSQIPQQEEQPQHPEKKQKSTMHGAAPVARQSSVSKPHSTPRNRNRTNQAFTPRFDVCETEDAYYLEGDLPGVSDKKTIGIEFSDERTLLVRGKVERSLPKPTTHAEVKKLEGETDEEHAERKRNLQPTVEDTDDEDDFTFVSTHKSEKKQEKNEEKKEEKKKEGEQQQDDRKS